MLDEVSAFRGREQLQRDRDELDDLVEAAWARGAHERLQLRKGLFDRIEIRAVGRQEPELGADGFDRRAHRWLFVHGEIVEHDHIARAQRRHQDLLDVGEKRRRVDRSVEHSRCPEAVEAQRRHDRVRLPVTAGRVIAEAGAAQAAAVPAQQIRRDATFIQKHILLRGAERLPSLPLPPGGGDIRPTLLVGVYRFF